MNNDEQTAVVRKLVRLKAKPQAVALDLGTGPGRILRVLLEEKFRVYGCELDPERAREARQIEGAVVDIANVLEWKPPSLADVITCIELIEHLYSKDQRILLERIHSWLSPDGLLVLSTPQRYSVVSIIEQAFSAVTRQEYAWWDPTHVAVLSRRRLEELFSGTGFRIIDRVGYHILPDVIAARLPVLRRWQRRAHRGLLRNFAFDQIYAVTPTGSVLADLPSGTSGGLG